MNAKASPKATTTPKQEEIKIAKVHAPITYKALQDEDEEPIDPEFLPKVQEIDPESILKRMDEFETNSAKLSAKSDKCIEEMK